MCIDTACDAIEKGCCLELYYERHSLVVEPHTVGFDPAGRPALLAWECSNTMNGHSGAWLFLRLDKPRRILVSGYFSLAPRAGFDQADSRFARMTCQVQGSNPIPEVARLRD